MATNQQQVIVIGAGYAGLLATIRLAGKVRRQNVRITLISGSDKFVERVRLHQMAAGRDIGGHSIAAILQGTGANFQQGMVTGIDTNTHMVIVQTGTQVQQYRYDYLVYALGSSTERETVPGVDKYAYTLTPTGPLSALALREKLPALAAVGGRVLVCGGGATGIEAAAEFAKAFPKLHVRLITQDEFGTFLGKGVASYMRHSLVKLGVAIQDRTTVAEVTATEIITASGATIPYDVCLWTGGFTTPTLAREVGLTVNERGQILTDPFMHSISHPEIYAVGDSAQPIEEPGVPVRMSAFTSVITGAHGADSLSAAIRGKTPRPLSFTYTGQGIALGHHNAIGFNNYPDDTPNLPYFTGRVGYEVREFFVRFLAALPFFEKRWPGFFWWIGKGRYAAGKRRAVQPIPTASTR